MSMGQARLDGLTSVRFFAAAHVVVLHFSNAFSVPSIPALEQLRTSGDSSVTLFFILSGFVLAYSYAEGLNSPQSRVQFFIARAARLLPVYLIAAVASGPVQRLMYEQFHMEYGLRPLLTSGALNFSLLQAWVPIYALRWNGPAWSISAEVLFYSLFPLLTWLVHRLSRRGRMLSFLLCVVTSSALAWTYTLVIEPQRNWALTCLLYFPLFRVPEFMAGLLLGHAFRAPGASVTPRVAVVALTVGLTGSLLVLSSPIFEIVRPALLVPIYGALIVGVAASPAAIIRPLTVRPLILLGEASYSMYILHWPLMYWVALSAGTTVPQVVQSHGALLFYYLLLIGLSVLSYRFVEVPCRTFIRARFRPARAVA